MKHNYDDAISACCRIYNMPMPVGEHRFWPERLFRFDYAWLDQKIALEVEGGTWTGGRHGRGKGMKSDMEKYNRAVLMGWRVLRCTPDQLRSGEVFAELAELMGLEPVEQLR